MFLVNLKNMEERLAFCNLATAVINSDDKQGIREITLFKNYIKEMIINNDIALDDVSAFSEMLINGIPKQKLSEEKINENIDIFLPASKRIRKTVLFELIFLANCDNDFASKEKELINHIAQKFNFSNNLIEDMLSIIVSLESIYTSALNIVQN